VCDIKKLLGFPFEDREWLIKLMLGSVITIVPILNFLSLGYFIRCINYGWRGRRRLPHWDNWSELFRDGCMAFLIALAYLTIPIAAGFLIALIPVVGIVLVSIIIFIMGIIIPMAVANYAMRRNLRDAFCFGEIFYRAGRVLNYYITGYIATTLGVILGAALLFGLPIIGFVGGLIIFYCGVVFGNLLGNLYRQAN
jgi:hypothetical protein